ncbi:MAG: alpha/beta fold hydrolase [Planctomycetaceae bacterium]|nr:alpha/beta fold hydrolase [Planctomycetaceae bacterium]
MTAPKLPAELHSEYPFEPKSILIDEFRYSYVDQGTGPVLLFVHGNPTWSFAWRNLIQELSPDYRCVAVDHLGMGLSEKPRDYGYTISQHIANLRTFVETLDLQEITLIGHDWGGCIGMGAAGKMPDRFRRFVMMNTAAFRSSRIPLRIAACRIPVLGALGVRGLNLFSRAALSMAVEDPSHMPPVVQKGYLFPYDSWEHRQAVHRFVQEIPMRPSHPTWETLVAVEAGLEQFRDSPLLLFWGERDWCFTTAFLKEWQNRFPHAETETYADAGHYVFEEAHEQIVPRLRKFLESMN